MDKDDADDKQSPNQTDFLKVKSKASIDDEEDIMEQAITWLG